MTDNYTNRTWLYHGSGAKVEVALPFGALETAKTIAEYLAAGFTVNIPEGGQKPLHVDYVVRCEFEYKGKKKERIYFYDMTSQFSSSALTLYLDSPEIIAAFEAAAGFTVDSMPVTRGKAAVTSDSDYFTSVARPVDFTVNRRKVNVTDENPNGNWELISYVSANPKPQQQPPTENGGDQPNYETEALNWFASNGVAFADVKVILGMEKLQFPASNDKAGWAKIMRDYAAIVKAKAS